MKKPGFALFRIFPLSFIFITLIFLFFQLQVFTVHFDFRDEGFLINNAVRITHGDVPYRDFFLTTTPGTFYIQALLLHVFGNYLILARILYMVIVVGILFLASQLFRFKSYLDYLWLFVLGVAFVGPAYAFYNIEALILFLLTFYLLRKTYKKGELWLFVLLGLTTAVMFLIKQSYGMANVVIVLLSLYVSENKKSVIKHALCYLLGFSVVILTYGCYLLSVHALHQFIYYVFFFSRAVKGHRMPFIITSIIFIPLYIFVVNLLKRVSLKHKIYMFTAFVVGFFGLYLLISPARAGRLLSVFGDPLVYYYLAFLLVPLTAIGLYCELKTKQECELVMLALFSLGLFLASASSGRDYTTVLMVSPFFLPLCVSLLQTIPTKLSRREIGAVIVVVYAIPFFFFGINTIVSLLHFNSSMISGTLATAIKIPQDEFRELAIVIPYIQEHVAPTGNILCFPYCPLLSPLTNRGNTSYFSFFYPETFQVSDQKKVIDDIIRNKPSLIILQRKGSIEAEANFEDKRLPVLRSYILSHTHLVKVTPNFAIYAVNH